MSISQEVKGLQEKDCEKTLEYQEAAKKFACLVERGLVSKRSPLELGRSEYHSKIYVYQNPIVSQTLGTQGKQF
jgi:hypothetical protein